MKQHKKMHVALMTLVLAACAIIAGTLAWSNLGQAVKNEAAGVRKPVALQKWETDINGQHTDIPVADAAFLLFTQDGTQVGAVLHTDADGAIHTVLSPGEYYFREQTPPNNYGLDIDDYGHDVTDYPFTVTGAETEELVVTVYNRRLIGSLIVEKILHNRDGSEPTPEQLQKPFTFHITFSDGGTYDYTLDGQDYTFTSGGTIQLKAGQKAVFSKLPAGVFYTVTEEPDDDYSVHSTGHMGNIKSGNNVASFHNIFESEGGRTGTLTVTKEVLSQGASNLIVPASAAASDDASSGSSSGIVPATPTDVPGETLASPTDIPDDTPASPTNIPADTPATSTDLPDRGEDSHRSPVLLGDPAQEQVFAFTVDFSDGVSYHYTIDDGDEQELEGGTTLYLRAGQKAVFLDVPSGTEFTVTELPCEGYKPLAEVLHGVIVAGQDNLVLFRNVTQTYQSVEEYGSLSVTKTIRNASGEPLEQEQNDLEFTFTVTFTDGCSYDYAIDGGELTHLNADGTIILRHGQTATFPRLPAGVGYHVEETDYLDYLPTMVYAHGLIMAGEKAPVEFVNVNPIRDGVIRVTKSLLGEAPSDSAEKEFAFTITIAGETTDFTLKPGETKEFPGKIGDSYVITETDYSRQGYSASIVSGAGTLDEPLIEVTAVNTFVGIPMMEISGEKRWDLVGFDRDVLPESIHITLWGDDIRVAEKDVTPNDDGKWAYQFTEPKYTPAGELIHYRVEETPITSFDATYYDDTFDITNTYVPPIAVDPPVAIKQVEGEDVPVAIFRFTLEGARNAPMPDGAENNRKTVERSGAGEAEFGFITFTDPGNYTYYIYEESGTDEGWTYDDAVYTLTVEVTKENGQLTAEKKLTRQGEDKTEALFVNSYEEVIPTTVTVAGQKHWDHRNNPMSRWPASIVVRVYGDGKLAAQKQVTAEDNWQYSFELPRFTQDGKEIRYTVDEAPVSSYRVSVRGYDLYNVYAPYTPSEPSEPVSSSKTGDTFSLALYATLAAAAAAGAYILLRRKKKTSGK